MAVSGTYQRVLHTPLFALNLVDRFAREVGATGVLPAPLGEVRCVITGQQLPAVRTFTPPLTLWTIRNRSGYFLLDGTFSRPGEIRRRPLEAGVYDLEIRATGYQTARVPLDWREPPVRLPLDLDLAPGPAYPFPDLSSQRFSLGYTLLRGSVFQSDGTPAAGAVARVTNLVFNPPWALDRCESDAAGNWVLALPDRRRFGFPNEIEPAPVVAPIVVRIDFPAPPGGFVNLQANVTLGREHLFLNTAMRGAARGPGGRPVTGARITTSANARTSLAGPDGRWTLYFDLDQADVNNVTVTATAPGGAVQAHANLAIRQGRTVVVPTFQFP